MQPHMKKQEIFGLSAALVTPFAPDGSVDLPRLVRHARRMIEEGCDSVTLFGTTGEGFSIAAGERAAMLGALLGGGVPTDRIYAGVTATAVADAVEQALLALDAGACGLLLAPPFYFKDPGDEGLYAWFSRAIEGMGATARGVILYNIPGQTAVPLSVELVGRLKAAFPGVVRGVKDSSGDPAVADAFLAAHGELAILIGDERLLAAAMRKGAEGSICGVANLLPQRLRAVIHDGADDPLIQPLVDLIVSHPVLPAIKALVAHRLADEAYRRVRAPVVELAPERRLALLRAFDRILSAGDER